jgi:hypothetical protein
VRVRAFTTHAALAALRGDLTTSAISLSQAVPLAREADDPVNEDLATWILGCVELLTGNPREAQSLLDHALQLLTAATSSTVRSQIAHVWAHRGVAAFCRAIPGLG